MKTIGYKQVCKDFLHIEPPAFNKAYHFSSIVNRNYPSGQQQCLRGLLNKKFSRTTLEQYTGEDFKIIVPITTQISPINLLSCFQNKIKLKVDNGGAANLVTRPEFTNRGENGWYLITKKADDNNIKVAKNSLQVGLYAILLLDFIQSSIDLVEEGIEFFDVQVVKNKQGNIIIKESANVNFHGETLSVIQI